MFTKTTRRPRLGLVAGVIAVALATSSGAYAAGALITSSAQIKTGVVTSSDIKNRTLKVKDLSPKTVEKLDPTLEAWHNFDTPGNPQLTGFWVVFPGQGYLAPGFRKNADGEVSLRGAVTQNANVASTSNIATLPAGYRPTACTMFSVATFNGLGGEDPEGAIQICPDGDVTMYEEGDDRFVSLDGISFYVD